MHLNLIILYSLIIGYSKSFRCVFRVNKGIYIFTSRISRQLIDLGSWNIDQCRQDRSRYRKRRRMATYWDRRASCRLRLVSVYDWSRRVARWISTHTPKTAAVVKIIVINHMYVAPVQWRDRKYILTIVNPNRAHIIYSIIYCTRNLNFFMNLLSFHILDQECAKIPIHYKCLLKVLCCFIWLFS